MAFCWLCFIFPPGERVHCRTLLTADARTQGEYVPAPHGEPLIGPDWCNRGPLRASPISANDRLTSARVEDQVSSAQLLGCEGSTHNDNDHGLYLLQTQSG